MSAINVHYAIRDVRDFIPSFIPAVGKTQLFNLGYGRLKLWRVTDRLVWCGFILPYKHNPTLDNLLHLTPEELVAESRKAKNE